MIEIERRNWLITIRTIYFGRTTHAPNAGADVIGYIQSAEPAKGLERVDTLHIDLTRSAEALYSAVRKSTRNEINRAHKKDGFVFKAISEPSKADLQAFTTFYNVFAHAKGTTPCGAYHVQTMQLLTRSKALAITRIADGAGPLCYHVYVNDVERAMLLYSGSHFRSARQAQDRRRLARANRYLHWRDMLYFKERGFQTYDWGGLTHDAKIAEFKRSFGGVERTEYTGYVPLTLKGRAAAAARAMLSAARSGVFNPRGLARGLTQAAE